MVKCNSFNKKERCLNKHATSSCCSNCLVSSKRCVIDVSAKGFSVKGKSKQVGNAWTYHNTTMLLLFIQCLPSAATDDARRNGQAKTVQTPH